MSSVITADFLIIGGGIVGLTIARQCKAKNHRATVIVIEKEKKCGLHASGRNSGVLHAGFYYTTDSLKAKFTRLGNQLLTEYCEQKKIPLHRCGKLVVAQNENDLVGMSELLKRGNQNGVLLYEITAEEAKAIEPRVITHQKALFSPTTSSVNPESVMLAIQQDAEAEGIQFHCDVAYLKKKSGNRIVTTMGEYEAGHVINAAGLYADKIAQDFHFSENYRILPFKGIYLYSNEPLFSMNTHIYPVPDLKNPFLGVHFTVTAEGKTKIGPTAIPAFWREQYHFLNRFKLTECAEILMREIGLLFYSQFNFKKLAIEEIKKYYKPHLVKLASHLAKDIKKENFLHFGKAGIRAQLINIKEKKLEMDFIIEGDQHSTHILNAVSPGFTSSIPFSEYVYHFIR